MQNEGEKRVPSIMQKKKGGLQSNVHVKLFLWLLNVRCKCPQRLVSC